jgi:hypothetical protein
MGVGASQNDTQKVLESFFSKDSDFNKLNASDWDLFW